MAKRQEPQTAEGLARVIAAILNLYAKGECRDSECKEGINHLIRAYGKRFCHTTPSHISAAAADENCLEPFVDDHVVPVKVMMAHLMGDAKANRSINAVTIQEFLYETSRTCRITASEDDRLRKARLWSAMPDRALCPTTKRILNPWARYEDHRVAITFQSISVTA